MVEAGSGELSFWNEAFNGLTSIYLQGKLPGEAFNISWTQSMTVEFEVACPAPKASRDPANVGLRCLF